MNNERIDLTQFEGLTTPWDFHAKYLHIESAKVAVKLIAELKRCYEELDEAKIVAEAAENLSNMIDPMWEKLDDWMMCFDDHSMHAVSAVKGIYGNTLDEKYTLDNLGNIILKELYSYTEEDGWQRKE
tara:strand:- start:382 stop:765 length:384 start_codon:yes stop_codon:yes gene_type:complete